MTEHLIPASGRQQEPGKVRKGAEEVCEGLQKLFLGKLTLRHGEHPVDAEVGVDSFNVLNHANFNNYV